MVTKFYSTVTIGLLALLTGCSPKGDNSSQPIITPVLPGTLVPPTGTAGLLDPLIPDSINTYRPEFGRATTVRQFPFGLADRPTTSLKLSSILYNGKTVRTYQYDEQGRLAQRKDYYTNGIQIFRQFGYSYGVDGVAEITSQLNKEAPVVEGYPKSSDLLPSATIMFTRPADSLSRIERNAQTEFAVYKFELGLTRSRLGFNPKGILVWEETIDEKDKTSQYTLYRPNELGNIVFSRTGSLFNKWQALRFTFDNKPNPFRTTGDPYPQPVNLGDLYGISVTANANNALTQSSINSQGGRDNWRYTYDYRPDGYPYRMLSYRNEELAGTTEFIYNQ